MDPKPTHRHRLLAPSVTPPPRPAGGYTVANIHEGDPFELSDGKLILCLPSKERHGKGVSSAAEVLRSDPAAEHVNVDVGHELGAKTLRAPDISVGTRTTGEETGWGQGGPKLAIEHADVGQDEADLQKKISELLGAGTVLVWVVRLTGIQRVEVYQRQTPRKKTFGLDAVLTAPGILKNPVPVRAFFDSQLAHRLTLHNLIERFGVEAVMTQTKAAAVLAVLAARRVSLSPEQQTRITLCSDAAQLDRWIVAAATATNASELDL